MGAAAIPLMIAGGAMSASAQLQAGKDQNNYYQYLSGVSNINAGLSRAAGESATRTVGAQEMQQVGKLHEQGREVVGAQKVALAAGGAGVGSKTGEQIASDTATKVNLDEMALRYNADLKMKDIRLGAEADAMNEENKAAGYKLAGKQAKRAAGVNAFNTILGTGSQVALTRSF